MLLDTHAFVWAIQDNPKLGNRARQILDAKTEEGLAISAITPWEISMLVRKGRMRLQQHPGIWIKDALARNGINLAPVEPEIAVDAGQLEGIHGDPADRLIIATARRLACPLLTADQLIVEYGKAGHMTVIDARL